jgi:hypothetical protein
MIDKDASTIVIRKGVVRRNVAYNAETQFTIQNKAGGSIDVLSNSRRESADQRV